MYPPSLSSSYLPLPPSISLFLLYSSLPPLPSFLPSFPPSFFPSFLPSLLPSLPPSLFHSLPSPLFSPLPSCSLIRCSSTVFLLHQSGHHPLPADHHIQQCFPGLSSLPRTNGSPLSPTRIFQEGPEKKIGVVIMLIGASIQLI